MNRTYYTVKGWKEHEFNDLEEAQNFCNKMYITDERVIEKHEVEDIIFTPDRNRPAVKDMAEIVSLVKDKMCAEDSVLVYRNDIHIDGTFEYSIKCVMSKDGLLQNKSPHDRLDNVKEKAIYNDYFKNYIRRVLEKVPTDKLYMCRLVTDYSPCNCIGIYANDTWPHIIPDFVEPDSEEGLDDYGDKYGCRSICIMFRGDESSKDIVIDYDPCVCGWHVDLSANIQIDRITEEIKNYITDVLEHVFK